jgi:multiple sugar transport system permease protein
MTTLPRKKSFRDIRLPRIHWSGETVLGILFVAPLVLWLLGTILYPLISAIQTSFLDVGMIGTGGKFVGFDNYKFVLSSPEFWSALGRSLLWVVFNAVVQTGLAFCAALILKQHFRGVRFARIWIILSWIVPTVVVVIIFRWILGTAGGIVNYLLVTLGIVSAPVGFFASGGSAFTYLTLINSWRWFPLMTVILLAGMQTIPEDLYEAAKVDGASAWQRLSNITLPGLQAVLFALGLVGTLWSINVFDIIWLMTGGGPGTTTQTLPVLVYFTAFKAYRLSRASAASVIFGLLLIVLVVLYLHFFSPPTEEEQ